MSEIKQINTGVDELLVRRTTRDGYSAAAVKRKDTLWHPINGVDIEWHILGWSDELTEEQCMELMPKSHVWFERYIYNGKLFWSAKEAFASLMQANGINETHIILKRLS